MADAESRSMLTAHSPEQEEAARVLEVPQVAEIEIALRAIREVRLRLRNRCFITKCFVLYYGTASVASAITGSLDLCMPGFFRFVVNDDCSPPPEDDLLESRGTQSAATLYIQGVPGPCELQRARMCRLRPNYALLQLPDNEPVFFRGALWFKTYAGGLAVFTGSLFTRGASDVSYNWRVLRRKVNWHSAHAAGWAAAQLRQTIEFFN
jgi:hypothetical protein